MNIHNNGYNIQVSMYLKDVDGGVLSRGCKCFYIGCK